MQLRTAAVTFRHYTKDLLGIRFVEAELKRVLRRKT